MRNRHRSNVSFHLLSIIKRYLHFDWSSNHQLENFIFNEFSFLFCFDNPNEFEMKRKKDMKRILELTQGIPKRAH